jgi:iron complex outermembrane receptor protein
MIKAIFLTTTKSFFFSVAMLSCSITAICQGNISGLVMDTDHQPIDGAYISVKNTGVGTITETNGRFFLKAKTGDVLIISAVGMIEREVIVRSNEAMIIIMSFAASNLEEVVVIGYGTARKKEITGAAASIRNKDFNPGIFASPDKLVQGKIPGLQIASNNGQPGGTSNIKIRGNSALSGTGQPLFVIDGVSLDGRSLQAGINPLNFINPADVASIDVLKDASATAIYGSRAAYGVILINTKKGRNGPTKIDIGIAAGITSILRKIDILNPGQFRQAIQHFGVNSNIDMGGNEDALGSILQNGLQTNYTIGASGGSENGKYRISGNVLDGNGIIKNTGFKKYGASIIGNLKFPDSKKLGLDISINTNQFIQEVPHPESGANGLFFFAIRWNPTLPLKNDDGTFRSVASGLNPAAQVEMMKSNVKVTTVLGNLSPYYKINSWLEYRLLFSVNYSAGISRFSIQNSLLPPGKATIRHNELTTKQIVHTLNINKQLSPHLLVNATAGFEFSKFKMKGFSASGDGIPGTGGFGNFGLDYTNYIQFSDPNYRDISSYADPSSELQSYFGRVIFNLSEKYLVTATIRADGSSKFGNNNKYGWFPSFAAAWYPSKEKFFTIDFINSLKIRAGWGITGNQEFPAGSAQARYSFLNGGVIRQINNPNPNLKWQSDQQVNIGLDFIMLNNRISGTIDYFRKTTSNLLFPSPPIQPSPLDAGINWTNLNSKIKNNGLEFSITTLIISKENFHFDLNINSTFLKNTVSGSAPPIYTGFVGGPVQVIQDGLPMNAFYTRKFIRIDNTTGFSVFQNNGTTLHYTGDPNPNVLFGINPSIRYKKFSLSVSGYGMFGQDIYNAILMNNINVAGFSSGSNIALSLFKEPVKESVANPVSTSSRFIMKGNYLKISHITIGYTLGNVAKLFRNGSIYLTGQNLFIITKYPGFDPESNYEAGINGIPSLGIDNTQYPSSRTVILGINFSL